MTERERKTAFGDALITIRTKAGVPRTKVEGFRKTQIYAFERRGTAPTPEQLSRIGSSLRLDGEKIVFLETLAVKERENNAERRKQWRKKLSHKREQEVVDHLKRILLSDRIPPSFAALGREHTMAASTVATIAHRSGHYEQLIEAKDRVANVFVPGRDTAWVLGVLIAAKGNVRPNKFSFNAKDRVLLQEFKGICGRLMSEGGKKKRAITQKNTKTTTVSFFDKNAVQALGDFSPKALARTIRTKHKWVFDELYRQSFVSGMYDSGAIVDKGNKTILFATTEEFIAKFWRGIFADIGVQSEIESHYKRGMSGVIIRKQAEVKKLAAYVESRSPETRRQLKELSALEKRKRRMAKPESVAQIYAEWIRLKALNKGKPMPSYKINALYATDDALFPSSIFTRYFGETPGEHDTSKKFSVATRRLEEEFGVLEPEELDRVLAEMPINPDQKIATIEEIVAEGRELYVRGIPFTINAIRREFYEGRTKHEPRIYMRYLGVDGDNPPTWRLARERFMLLAFPEDQNGSQVYP